MTTNKCQARNCRFSFLHNAQKIKKNNKSKKPKKKTHNKYVVVCSIMLLLFLLLALSRHCQRFNTNMYNNNKICMQNRRWVLNACIEWLPGCERLEGVHSGHQTAIYIDKYAGRRCCCCRCCCCCCCCLLKNCNQKLRNNLHVYLIVQRSAGNQKLQPPATSPTKNTIHKSTTSVCVCGHECVWIAFALQWQTFLWMRQMQTACVFVFVFSFSYGFGYLPTLPRPLFYLTLRSSRTMLIIVRMCACVCVFVVQCMYF